MDSDLIWKWILSICMCKEQARSSERSSCSDSWILFFWTEWGEVTEAVAHRGGWGELTNTWRQSIKKQFPPRMLMEAGKARFPFSRQHAKLFIPSSKSLREKGIKYSDWSESRQLIGPHWGSVHSWQVLNFLFSHPLLRYREKAMAPTPVPLPGESHGWRSLVGCRPCGR